MNTIEGLQDKGYTPYGPASETAEDAREILQDVQDNTPGVTVTLAKNDDGEYLVMMKESSRTRRVIEGLTKKYRRQQTKY